jgi:hypothetical protein
MIKFIKAVVIGYAVLWATDKITNRRCDDTPKKKIPLKRGGFHSLTK